MGLVVGLGRRTGAEQPGLVPLKMYDNLALNTGERRTLPIANRPHNPQPCRRGKGFDLGQGAKPQAAARNHRGRAIRKGVILIKGDIIACDLDLLKPQPHRHVIGGDQGDFGPCGHPVLPRRTGRITGFKNKLPARRQNSGHRTKGLQDIIICQQALKRVAGHIDQIIALIAVKTLQRTVLPVCRVASAQVPPRRAHGPPQASPQPDQAR